MEIGVLKVFGAEPFNRSPRLLKRCRISFVDEEPFPGIFASELYEFFLICLKIYPYFLHFGHSSNTSLLGFII